MLHITVKFGLDGAQFFCQFAVHGLHRFEFVPQISLLVLHLGTPSQHRVEVVLDRHLLLLQRCHGFLQDVELLNELLVQFAQIPVLALDLLC